MSALAEILDLDDPDELWSEVVDLILEHKDENQWRRVEQNIVALGVLERWVLNGGFESYLCMPSGANARTVRRALSDLGSVNLVNAFDQALSAFGEISIDDVQARQGKTLSEQESETISKANKLFYSESDDLPALVAEYIRANQKRLRWIDHLPRPDEGAPSNERKLHVYMIEEKPWWKFWRRPKRTLIHKG